MLETAEGRLAEAHDDRPSSAGLRPQQALPARHTQQPCGRLGPCIYAASIKNLGFLQLLVVLEQGEEPDSYAIDKHITIKLPVRDL